MNGYNIFYDLEDYLVFYTVFASVSRKYDLKVTGLCLMVDHLHVLVQSDIESVVSRFVSHYTSVFVNFITRMSGVRENSSRSLSAEHGSEVPRRSGLQLLIC